MGDIFISYAREDGRAAQRIADGLSRHGFAVWWDPDIAPGAAWETAIEGELAGTGCVVVLWSATSVAKAWVRAEAADALERGLLVPVVIEDIMPPLAFRHLQSASLADWRGEDNHPGFRQVLKAVASHVKARGDTACRDAAHAGSGARGRSRLTAERRERPAAIPVQPRRPVPEPPVSAPTREASRISKRLGLMTLILAAGTIGYGIHPALERFASGAKLTWASPDAARGEEGNADCLSAGMTIGAALLTTEHRSVLAGQP